MARLKTKYDDTIRPALIERFGYSSPMQAPKIEKITVNMGVGEAKQDSKMLEQAQTELATITGQKPNVRRARKSIAAFKLREGMPVGLSVTLRGEEITNMRADQLVKRGIGFVPQTNNVFPSLTIEENLQMGAYQAPTNFTERFDFVTNLFPTLGDRRKQRAGSLSGGERQGVAIGRAMHFEAELIVLDEPTVALSLKEVRKVLNFVHKIKEAGKACIYITHAIQDVYEVADRFIVLDRGEVVASINKKNMSLKELDEFLLEYAHGLKDKRES